MAFLSRTFLATLIKLSSFASIGIAHRLLCPKDNLKFIISKKIKFKRESQTTERLEGFDHFHSIKICQPSKMHDARMRVVPVEKIMRISDRSHYRCAINKELNI